MMIFVNIIVVVFSVLKLVHVNGQRYERTTALQEGPYFYDIEAIENRRAQYPIHPMILGRRSLREMSGEDMSDEELFPLFEAAKWAPSHFNIQEWRFVYAHRNSRYWKKFLNVLTPGNQEWAKDASVLVVLMSNRFNTYKGRKTFVRSHSFDAGAAWMAMSLEGVSRGYVVHAMAGVDYPKAARTIRMPNTGDYTIEVMIAIGKRRNYRLKTDEKTSQRKSLNEIVSEGYFSPKF